MTTDLKTNYDAETNTSDVEKITNRHKQNFEDKANNMQLDKEDSQRSNLNNKYLSSTLVLKYCDSFICFYCIQSIYFLTYICMIWYYGTKPE